MPTSSRPRATAASEASPGHTLEREQADRKAEQQDPPNDQPDLTSQDEVVAAVLQGQGENKQEWNTEADEARQPGVRTERHPRPGPRRCVRRAQNTRIIFEVQRTYLSRSSRIAPRPGRPAEENTGPTAARSSRLLELPLSERRITPGAGRKTVQAGTYSVSTGSAASARSGKISRSVAFEGSTLMPGPMVVLSETEIM